MLALFRKISGARGVPWVSKSTYTKKIGVRGVPWVSKSTYTKKIGNHVTVHRPQPVRPHHRYTNVYSHTF